MKHLFLSMAAVAMLASCSSEEVLDKAQTPKSAIGFSTFVDKSTRATESDDVDISNLKSIYVYGWRGEDVIFNGTTVTVDDNGVGGYTNTQYWERGYEYNFEAIHPANATAGITFSPSKDGGQITLVNECETDILYAKATSVTTNATDALSTEAVDFDLKHMLTRVKFSFKNGFGANAAAVLDISDLKIAGVCTTGSIKPTESEAKWNSTATSDVTFTGTGLSDISAESTGESDHKYLIPIKADGTPTYDVTFTVTLTQAEAVSTYYLETTIQANMEIGYSYDYTATITPENIITGGLEPINFSASMTKDWEAWDEVTIDENDIVTP